MEIARACFAASNTDNHQKDTSLDARRKKKERKVENKMEKKHCERDDSRAALLEFIEEAGRSRETLLPP